MKKPVLPLKQADQDTRTFFRALLDSPIVWGTAVEVVFATTSATRVRHGLGRAPQGWFIMRSTTPVTVTLSPTDTSYDANEYLALVPSVATTLTLWVF